MDKKLLEQLDYLGLDYLTQSWKEVMDVANKKKTSYHRFLFDIIQKEYLQRQEKRRIARLNAAKSPEDLVMETFPFKKQPKLRKRLVMDIYDSMSYMNTPISLYLVGPTGCGKSGLGISYLVNAINQGYRGRFITYAELMELSDKSYADLSTQKVLNRFANIDCLLIDELGYHVMNTEQAGFFFRLIKMRHQKKCTIFTTQLGFKEWASFFNDVHMKSACINRITENCALFNMQECISLRPSNIQYLTKK